MGDRQCSSPCPSSPASPPPTWSPGSPEHSESSPEGLERAGSEERPRSLHRSPAPEVGSAGRGKFITGGLLQNTRGGSVELGSAGGAGVFLTR